MKVPFKHIWLINKHLSFETHSLQIELHFAVPLHHAPDKIIHETISEEQRIFKFGIGNLKTHLDMIWLQYATA